MTNTPHDLKALELLPQKGWFEINEVSYRVQNPRWRCDRLADRGLLEREVTEVKLKAVAGATTLVTRFRRPPNKLLGPTAQVPHERVE